jgi:hypothetical protein
MFAWRGLAGIPPGRAPVRRTRRLAELPLTHAEGHSSVGQDGAKRALLAFHVADLGNWNGE